ncbi:hypothetical protein W909_11760 [Dickeya zeae EC1]|nr:hypothetical protein W909_11760 [Dickeya zeae EC1]
MQDDENRAGSHVCLADRSEAGPEFIMRDLQRFAQ